MVWALLSLFSTATWHLDLVRRGQSSDLSELLRSSTIQYAPWILITAAVFHLVSRRPWRPGDGLRRLRTYGAWTLVGLLVYLPVRGWTTVLARRRPASEMWSALADSSLFEWFFDSLLLAAIFALAVARLLSTETRRRERRAAALALHNAELETELNAARLHMLRAQLEPHFLHNALNTVAALVRCDRPEDAIDAVTQLSTLLRFAAQAAELETVTVAREADLAETYLEFQRIRFGDRLAFEIEVAPEVEDLEIPPLLLQPMLENAIRHGIESHEEASQVLLKAHREAERLCFEVTNRPYSDPSESTGLGIGLDNTRRRLTAHFGSRFELEGAPDGQCYRSRLWLELP